MCNYFNKRFLVLKNPTDPTDKISAYISKLEKLANDLKLAGENITDKMLITKILMTLPDSYQNFYSAWDSMQSEN